MILFRAEFIAAIREGRKTQTRRLWPKGPPVRKGSIHQCRTAIYGKPFARIVIRALRQELLRNISMEDCIAEGFTGPGTFLDAFLRINDLAFDANPVVWVVRFELFCVEGEAP